MTTFGQYWKRAYRSGHAYAEVGLRHLSTPEKLWARELARVSLMVLLPFLIIVAGVVIRHPVAGLVAALALAFKPFLRIPGLIRQYRISFSIALLYSLHSAFVVYPQFLGILRYIRTLITGMPLVNTGRKVSE